MPPRKQAKPQPVYQLKITLKDHRPPIWRRVQVLSQTTLSQLHWVIQLSMGWTNSHLHSFSIQGVEYGVPMPDFGFDDDIRDEQKVKLSKVISEEKFEFSYLYDFGDAWEHKILVEKVLEADPTVSYPICITGKRACPPEDCGGVWGYQDFLEAIQDPNHPEHEAMLEWIGGSFDPGDAQLEDINSQLKAMSG
ncbi:MAG: plasmid pRiA4b ORF-3 family protein [Leptolyngbyaceae cyanobacterium SM1_1_3]|nr:plasmid pRiA4b ORF-3 family protein [Leptolyngbyaceae cyanobacterium SM1_1_3]NJN02817.1 plasmid pRiA4b ORF-3 family protein [Leptolyngbyaceae cyanobacterium RM1_1_2]NJO10533.1 plasmid pRiA4b ORF-3 family protein [Leptolyngbyaceae cyanobacterium SL_1_1]